MYDSPAYVWAIIIAASMCGQWARMAWSWACSSAWRGSGRVSSQRVIWRVFGIAGAGPGAASACRNGRYSRDVKGGGRSVCTGQCLSAWPAVTGKPAAVSGIKLNGILGTIARPGGVVQATYNGYPLYTYAGDSGPGATAGNGVGGVWHMITGSVLTSSVPSSSGGSGGYGY
jgi:hypothetical protein